MEIGGKMFIFKMFAPILEQPEAGTYYREFKL